MVGTCIGLRPAMLRHPGCTPMSRTTQQRIDAIQPAIDRGREFRQRVTEAEGDAVKCADLMAEAIAMHREQRPLEAVGRDGRNTLAMEELEAMYCLDAARAAYLLARGSNRSDHV